MALPTTAPFFFETETAGLMFVRHRWPQSFRWWLFCRLPREDVAADYECAYDCPENPKWHLLHCGVLREPPSPVCVSPLAPWPHTPISPQPQCRGHGSHSVPASKSKKGAPKVEGGPRPKEETVLVATTTTSTTKASIRFAAFLCEISGSYSTFPPSWQAGLPWPTSGNRRQQSRRRYATNGFALSPYVPCSWTAFRWVVEPGSEVMRLSPSSHPSVPKGDAPVRPRKNSACAVALKLRSVDNSFDRWPRVGPLYRCAAPRRLSWLNVRRDQSTKASETAKLS